MALARTLAVALVGLDGHLVEVEADLAPGLPGLSLIGLPDTSLHEARDRVKAAIVNSGGAWPQRRITVGLSPASLPKRGSSFDLAIAIALLGAAEAVPLDPVRGVVFVGELALDGRLRPAHGVLPAVLAAARSGVRRVIVPAANVAEARLVPDLDVRGAATLGSLVRWLRGEEPDGEAEAEAVGPLPAPEPPDGRDLADVIGQAEARHALEVAAAGGHHALFVGPPGTGKTMLAERLPGLLPDLRDDDALEVTAIHSVAGCLPARTPLVTRPQFRAPHHTATLPALIGGGSGVAKPGAVSLAHRGVLFLDEAPEFATGVLDALRQPLESGAVTIARSGGIATYPARFTLVLAANPCPCSSVTGRSEACTCSPMARIRYMGRLSGPLLDRVDLRVALRPISRAELLADRQFVEPTAVVAERVREARARAAYRFRAVPWSTNAEIPGAELRRLHPVAADARRLLETALDRGSLSARGVDRAQRVAWTLADLRGIDRPGRDEVGEALLLRQHLAMVAA